jgi:hypothetical protein
VNKHRHFVPHCAMQRAESRWTGRSHLFDWIVVVPQLQDCKSNARRVQGVGQAVLLEKSVHLRSRRCVLIHGHLHTNIAVLYMWLRIRRFQSRLSRAHDSRKCNKHCVRPCRHLTHVALQQKLGHHGVWKPCFHLPVLRGGLSWGQAAELLRICRHLVLAALLHKRPADCLWPY